MEKSGTARWVTVPMETFYNEQQNIWKPHKFFGECFCCVTSSRPVFHIEQVFFHMCNKFLRTKYCGGAGNCRLCWQGEIMGWFIFSKQIAGPMPAPSQSIPAPQLIPANFLQVCNYLIQGAGMERDGLTLWNAFTPSIVISLVCGGKWFCNSLWVVTVSSQFLENWCF